MSMGDGLRGMLARMTSSQRLQPRSQEIGSTCGFRTVPDLETIVLSADNISPFSLPQEALSFEPDESVVISHFANGDEERKIHCNIELRKDEQDKLNELRELATKKEVVVSPAITVQATRYISATRAEGIEVALESMKLTHQWRQAYFAKGPIADSTVAADLRAGTIYFVGRDQALRPTLVIRVARMQGWLKEKGAERLIRVLVFCQEYFLRYMVCPGRVESINVLIDLKGLSFSSVNRHALGDVNKVLSNHYRMRVYRIYICNAPALISTIAGAIKRMLTDRQQQKLTFVANFEELAHEFALHQLEQDLGGTRPNLEEYFPFPLPPGPFEAGSRAGPRADAVPMVHEAVTAVGHRGRLWSTDLSSEENAALEYTERAAEILAACCLPAPPTFAVVSHAATV